MCVCVCVRVCVCVCVCVLMTDRKDAFLDPGRNGDLSERQL